MPTPQAKPFRFEEQIQFFLAKTNVPTQQWTDVWRDGHDTAFMVAGAYKAELLTDLRGAVNEAIAGGRSLAQFRKDFDVLVAKHGWSYNGGRGWRTRVIFETNLRTSYMAGRYAQLTEPEFLKAKPFWRYKHSESVQHPRPEHLAWDGLVIAASDPWWQAHYPPNGWGCKCTVYPESAASAARRGYTVTPAPDVETVPKLVGKNGPSPRLVDVPKGIDPGWDYAPGASAADRTRELVEGRAEVIGGQIGEDLREAVGAIPVAPPPPKVFRQPIGEVVVPDLESPVLPDVSTLQKAATVQFENTIRNEKLEYGAAFNSQGNKLLEKVGEPDRVSYSVNDLAAMRGLVFTHNHPLDTSFSVQDVLLAAEAGMKELRAVGPRLRYSFAGLDGITDLGQLEADIRRIIQQVNQQLSDAVKTTQLHIFDMNAYGSHLVWLRVAAELGLTYRREVS